MGLSALRCQSKSYHGFDEGLMFELRIFLRDRLIGRSTFTRDEVRIGRSADNEVQIDNPALSRYHASIEHVSGLYLLKDFGSQNGTFLNGERVAGRAGLNDGDRITAGKFTLVFGAEQRVRGTTPEVRDHASYAVAGRTMVMRTPVFERPCPWVGYLEERGGDSVPPPRHVIDRDHYLVGASEDCQLKLAGKHPRVGLLVRSWGGFSVVSLSPGAVVHNDKPVDPTANLRDGDRLQLGGADYAFHSGHPHD